MRIVAVVMLLVLLISDMCVGKKAMPSAAVPRSKGQSSLTSLFTSNSLLRNVVREVKSSFCSQLESLTLQMTKPSRSDIPIALIDELVGFLDLEYDSPETLVGVLVKLSRKFAELNVYTQCKSLLVLHVVMQRCEPHAQRAWNSAIQSMRQELDKKTGQPFFNVDAVEAAAVSASLVDELQTLDFNRHYATYVFELLTARGDIARSKSVTPQQLTSLLSIWKDAQSIGVLAEDIDSPICAQCKEALREDKTWLLQRLESIYREASGHSKWSRESLQEAESVLMQEVPSFMPYVPKPTVKPANETTSNKNAAPNASNQQLPLAQVSQSPKIAPVSNAEKVSTDKSIAGASLPSAVKSEQNRSIPKQTAQHPQATASISKPQHSANSKSSPPTKPIPTVYKQSIQKSLRMDNSASVNMATAPKDSSKRKFTKPSPRKSNQK